MSGHRASYLGGLIFQGAVNRWIGKVSMKYFNIFNFQGVSKSRKVARGPPPPATNRVKACYLCHFPIVFIVVYVVVKVVVVAMLVIGDYIIFSYCQYKFAVVWMCRGKSLQCHPQLQLGQKFGFYNRKMDHFLSYFMN